MQGAKIIIKKELKRVFQDRKLIFSMFILPAVLVIGIYSLMGLMIDQLQTDIEAHTSSVSVVGAPSWLRDAYTPEYLEKANISDATVDDVDSLKESIKAGELDLLVVFDPDFEALIASYSKAGDPIPQVNVFYNSTASYSSAANADFATVLGTLTMQIVASRIDNLELLNAFETVPTVIAEEAKQNGQFLSMMMPYLITILLFAGAMSIGVDMFAGEKERQTMAILLLTPVKRIEIAFGKLIALMVLSTLSALVYALAMLVSLPSMSSSFGLDEGTGGISFSAVQILELVAIMVAMVFLYASIVAITSVLAKNAKEAGTYVTPFYMVIMILGLITIFQFDSAKQDLVYAIPVYGNSLAIQSLLVNDLTPLQFLASIGSTLAISVVLMVGISKAFSSEKIMFNA
jgi:sodium transport system permease protein